MSQYVTNEPKRVAAYTFDFRPGIYNYVTAEGVGECRANFARLVADMEQSKFDIVAAMKAEFLFLDTSPMWIEKFIATAQRHHIIVVETASGREYDSPNRKTKLNSARSDRSNGNNAERHR